MMELGVISGTLYTGVHRHVLHRIFFQLRCLLRFNAIASNSNFLSSNSEVTSTGKRRLTPLLENLLPDEAL